MDSIFQNDWNALSDDLFLPMFQSRKAFNFKRLFSRDESQAKPVSVVARQSVFVKTLDIKGWEPADIELVVTADGKKLIVSGNKEETVEDENGESYSLRHFKQFVDLPKGIDEEEISSALAKNGCLMITAPYMEGFGEEENKQRQIEVEHTANANKGRQLLLRQDSKIEKSWNRMFDDFFLPVFESSGLSKSDDFWSDSSALSKHRSHVSKTMNNALAKRFNFQHESQLDNWDQVFDEFFFPMLESSRFFGNRSSNLFSASGNTTNVVANAATSNVFEKEFNLLGFQPADIQVRITSDGRLAIEAKKEQQESSDGGASYKLKEFRQSMTLPKNVDVDKLSSALKEESGKLVISAPLLSIQTADHKERQISIGCT